MDQTFPIAQKIWLELNQKPGDWKKTINAYLVRWIADKIHPSSEYGVPAATCCSNPELNWKLYSIDLTRKKWHCQSSPERRKHLRSNLYPGTLFVNYVWSRQRNDNLHTRNFLVSDKFSRIGKAGTIQHLGTANLRIWQATIVRSWVGSEELFDFVCWCWLLGCWFVLGCVLGGALGAE